MQVFRLTELPTGVNHGRLIVPEQVAVQTRPALMGFHGTDGKHEGLVYWIGRHVQQDSIVVGGIIPNCEHGPQRVMVSENTVGAIMRKARLKGLGIIAQVHSHSGDDTRHSEGDDKLVLMPFEGMFSVVVGRYGAGGITLETGVGLHQFQNGRWIQIQRNCFSALTIVPTMCEVLL